MPERSIDVARRVVRRAFMRVEQLEGRIAPSAMPSTAQAPTVIATIHQANPAPVVPKPVVKAPVQAAKPVQRDPLDLVVPILQTPPKTVAIPAKPTAPPAPRR